MSYTYDVPKNKYNRIGYRIAGIIFVVISLLQFFLRIKGYRNHMLLTMIFATILLMYGAYLISYSLRKQAFNIPYRFDENGMTVSHHYGETTYSFDDIEFITMVIADPNQIFYVLNIKTTKDLYTIPFTMKKDYCEAIYEFVNARIKQGD